jgi:hypothetical protein
MSPREPVPHGLFPVLDHELHVGGMPLSQLAARAGRTPFYAYDRDLLARRVRELRSVLPERVKLHYAIKANPMPALVGYMARLVDGLDGGNSSRRPPRASCSTWSRRARSACWRTSARAPASRRAWRCA